MVSPEPLSLELGVLAGEEEKEGVPGSEEGGCLRSRGTCTIMVLSGLTELE